MKHVRNNCVLFDAQIQCSHRDQMLIRCMDGDRYSSFSDAAAAADDDDDDDDDGDKQQAEPI